MTSVLFVAAYSILKTSGDMRSSVVFCRHLFPFPMAASPPQPTQYCDGSPDPLEQRFPNWGPPDGPELEEPWQGD